MKRVLMTGQSTAGGIGGGGPDFTGVNGLVDVWDNASSISGAVGTGYVTPVRGSAPFRSGDNGNPGIWFCDRYADEYEEAVQYTLIYKDGEGITNWHNGGEMDVRMEAVFTAQGSVPWDIVLWQQGDHEGINNLESSYAGWFATMHALWVSQGFIAEDTPFFVGSLGSDSTYDEMNTILAALPASYDTVKFVNFEDLATSDGTHFTASAMVTMGERHFASYQANFPPVLTPRSGRIGPSLFGFPSPFC